MKHLTTLFVILMSGSLLAQSEYCGVGTVWDAESQTCIVAENVELLDSNLDGVVGVEDLLNLLSHFGDEDMDFDGIYDSVDDCVGAYDECGVCNGPGPQILGIDTIIVYYDSLYAEAIDEWWVFEVDADTLLGYFCENPGCMDPTADNYDPYAIEEDGSCIFNGGSSICDYQTALYYHEEIYSLIPIGNQCWFVDHLRTTHYANGDSIPGGLSDAEWSQTDVGAQAMNPEYPQYGRAYNRLAVDDSRGLCPTGFHVSTDADWLELEMFAGMPEEVANSYGDRGAPVGTELKASESDFPAWNGTNLFGLSISQSNTRWDTGGWISGVGVPCYLWLGEEQSSSVSWRRFWQNSGGIDRQWSTLDENFGLSVRCVKDAQ